MKNLTIILLLGLFVSLNARQNILKLIYGVSEQISEKLQKRSSLKIWN